MLLFDDIRLKIAVVILILLSSVIWPVSLPFSAILLCCMGYVVVLKRPKMRLIQGLFLGLSIAASHVMYFEHVNQRLYSQGHDITIKGEIQSLIAFKEGASSILVQVKEINDAKVFFLYEPLVKLSIREYKKAYQSSASSILFQEGELWTFTVTLRPPIGKHNEVGILQEHSALSQSIHAHGKVKSAELFSSNTSFRSQWFLKVHNNTLQSPYQPLLLALTFGYKDKITATQWEVLRSSGLIHLMAISGLHIGFVYGIGWWVGQKVRALSQRKNTLWFPVIIGLMFAVFYSWLAGFSLPTIRALLACSLFSILLIGRVIWPKHVIYLCCMALCLILNPFSSLSMSFWLSFGAVFVVFMSLHFHRIFVPEVQNRMLNLLIQIIFIQLSLFIFLLPIQSYFFYGMSYFSPLINFIAIPWVSFIIVPLSLFSVAMELLHHEFAAFFWYLADLSLVPLWGVANTAVGHWLILPTWVEKVVLGSIICLMSIVIFGLSILRSGLMIFLLMAYVFKPSPKWQVDFLDVGHGLSVLLTTDESTVIYDTGMQWDTGSMAKRVIEPILHRRGLTEIDGLIISHSDNDHAGGRTYLTENFTPSWIRSSEYKAQDKPCKQGEIWQEGRFTFEALWPPKQVKRAYNPHSCVIKITIDDWHFLLTGDIDSISEMLLLNQYTFDDIDVFLVPHHGSLSSSSDRWVQRMKGRIAIVSSGLFSPWNLPNNKIKEKHHNADIKWLDTAHLGQVSITSTHNELAIKGYSSVNRSSWYRKLFGDNLNTE